MKISPLLPFLLGFFVYPILSLICGMGVNIFTFYNHLTTVTRWPEFGGLGVLLVFIGCPLGVSHGIALGIIRWGHLLLGKVLLFVTGAGGLICLARYALDYSDTSFNGYLLFDAGWYLLPVCWCLWLVLLPIFAKD